MSGNARSFLRAISPALYLALSLSLACLAGCATKRTLSSVLIPAGEPVSILVTNDVSGVGALTPSKKLFQGLLVPPAIVGAVCAMALPCVATVAGAAGIASLAALGAMKSRTERPGGNIKQAPATQEDATDGAEHHGAVAPQPAPRNKILAADSTAAMFRDRVLGAGDSQPLVDELRRDLRERAGKNWSLDADSPKTSVMVSVYSFVLEYRMDKQVCLHVNARVSVTVGVGQKETSARMKPYFYTSPCHDVADWLDAGSDALDTTIVLAGQQLATQIVADLLPSKS